MADYVADTYEELGDELNRFEHRAMSPDEHSKIDGAFKKEMSDSHLNAEDEVRIINPQVYEDGTIIRDRYTGEEVAVYMAYYMQDIEYNPDAGKANKANYEVRYSLINDGNTYGSKAEALNLLGLNEDDTPKPVSEAINRYEDEDDELTDSQVMYRSTQPDSIQQSISEAQNNQPRPDLVIRDKRDTRGLVIGPIKHEVALKKLKDSQVAKIESLNRDIVDNRVQFMDNYNRTVDGVPTQAEEVQYMEEGVWPNQKREQAKENIFSQSSKLEQESDALMKTVIKPELFRLNEKGEAVELDSVQMASNFSKLQDGEFMELDDVGGIYAISKVQEEDYVNSVVINDSDTVVSAVKIRQKGDVDSTNIYAVKRIDDAGSASINIRAEEKNGQLTVSKNEEALNRLGLAGKDFPQGVDGVGTAQYYQELGERKDAKLSADTAKERMVHKQVSPGGISGIISKKQIEAHNTTKVQQGSRATPPPINILKVAPTIAFDAKQMKALARVDTQLEIKQLSGEDLFYINKANFKDNSNYLEFDGRFANGNEDLGKIKYDSLANGVLITDKNSKSGKQHHIVGSQVVVTNDGHTNQIIEQTYTDDNKGLHKTQAPAISTSDVLKTEIMHSQDIKQVGVYLHDNTPMTLQDVINVRAENVIRGLVSDDFRSNTPSAVNSTGNLYGNDNTVKHPLTTKAEGLEQSQNAVNGLATRPYNQLSPKSNMNRRP